MGDLMRGQWIYLQERERGMIGFQFFPLQKCASTLTCVEKGQKSTAAELLFTPALPGAQGLKYKTIKTRFGPVFFIFFIVQFEGEKNRNRGGQATGIHFYSHEFELD